MTELTRSASGELNGRAPGSHLTRLLMIRIIKLHIEVIGADMPRKKLEPPRDFVIPGGHYPEGPFRKDTPPGVLASAAFCQTLAWVMGSGGGESQRKFAAKAGISQGVLSRALAGETYPDISSIANLENSMAQDFWVPYRERMKQIKLGA